MEVCSVELPSDEFEAEGEEGGVWKLKLDSPEFEARSLMT